VRWKRIDGFVHFYDGVSKEEQAKKALSILFKRKLSKNIIDQESIDENLIRVNLNWMQRKITIISI